MGYWKPEPWKPSFTLIPRIGVDGRFVWGRCERRKLTNRHDDGYDYMRRLRSIWQIRAVKPYPSACSQHR